MWRSEETGPGRPLKAPLRPALPLATQHEGPVPRDTLLSYSGTPTPGNLANITEQAFVSRAVSSPQGRRRSPESSENLGDQGAKCFIIY